MLRSVFSGGLALALAVGVVQAQSGSPSPGDLLKDPAVKAAIDAAKATEAQTIADQIRFCEIPAPSFKEDARGQELKRVFQQLGLQNVRIDKAGNVLGDYPGAAAHPHLVLAAHLDKFRKPFAGLILGRRAVQGRHDAAKCSIPFLATLAA